MEENLTLQIQLLGRADHRALVLGGIQGLRSGDGWFSPAELNALAESLRLPRIGNVNQTLALLRGRGYVLRRASGGRWALTPLGQKRVEELMGALDVAQVEAELVGSPGTDFGQRLHSVISPRFAPVSVTPRIAQFLDRFPFERNVFCMTRFPQSQNDTEYLDPIDLVLPTIREAVGSHGLTLHAAFERQLDDQLYANVAAHMWACQYGIGILEDRIKRGLNYNVMIELGAMLMTGRRCALLKDRTAPELPTDIAGHIYKSIDLDDVDEVSSQVHAWAARDLNLGTCPGCS